MDGQNELVLVLGLAVVLTIACVLGPLPSDAYEKLILVLLGYAFRSAASVVVATNTGKEAKGVTHLHLEVPGTERGRFIAIALWAVVGLLSALALFFHLT